MTTDTASNDADNMTDEWLAKAAHAAAIVASGYPEEYQELAFFRGFANRVLLAFEGRRDAAFKIDFTGRETMEQVTGAAERG